MVTTVLLDKSSNSLVIIIVIVTNYPKEASFKNIHGLLIFLYKQSEKSQCFTLVVHFYTSGRLINTFSLSAFSQSALWGSHLEWFSDRLEGVPSGTEHLLAVFLSGSTHSRSSQLVIGQVTQYSIPFLLG